MDCSLGRSRQRPCGVSRPDLPEPGELLLRLPNLALAVQSRCDAARCIPSPFQHRPRRTDGWRTSERGRAGVWLRVGLPQDSGRLVRGCRDADVRGGHDGN